MTQVRISWVKVCSITLNVVLLAFLLRCCTLEHPCGETTTVVIHDTIRPKDELKLISHEAPKPIKTIHRIKVSSYPLVSVSEPDSIPVPYATEITPLTNPCNFTNIYSDTLSEPDNYRVVINDTLQDNAIYGRSVWFVNLKPEIRTTIKETIVKREKWKFYVGGSFTYNQKYLSRMAVGISPLITIPKVGGISYTFSIPPLEPMAFSHQLNVYALIRFTR